MTYTEFPLSRLNYPYIFFVPILLILSTSFYWYTLQPDNFWEAVLYDFLPNAAFACILTTILISTWRSWLAGKKLVKHIPALILLIPGYLVAQDLLNIAAGIVQGPQKKTEVFEQLAYPRRRFNNKRAELYFADGQTYSYRDRPTMPVHSLQYGQELEIEYVPGINHISRIENSN